MHALVDCNSFFCSVEKVFHPGLEGKPVVVLSSNDGCIVALTPEAKAIGLHRGDPIFRRLPRWVASLPRNIRAIKVFA